jgi:F0F1-type ATP synthase gamma subunit
MLENNCSEHASRMSAMENSTKSAGEMLTKLTLKCAAAPRRAAPGRAPAPAPSVLMNRT